MRAADTNVLVRIVARDDLQQTAIAEAFIDQGAWVSVVALAEAVWVLSFSYKRTAEQLAAIIEGLLNHQRLSLQDSDAVAQALDLFRARPSLGFADCLILQLARKAGHLPLGTFDRALARVDGTQKL
jgi:predicted nucleic-acid-binding protein